MRLRLGWISLTMVGYERMCFSEMAGELISETILKLTLKSAGPCCLDCRVHCESIALLSLEVV